MQYSKVFTLITLLLSTSFNPVTSAPLKDDPYEVTAKSASMAPRAAGRLFDIDGTRQYFSGVNAWWLGHLYDYADVDQAFSQISASGFKTARIWAFGNTNNPATETNIYYQTLNSSGAFINYDPARGIARLDYAVQKAASLNIKLVMVLLNNFDDLGGINMYTNAFGGDHKSFFTDARSQQAYKDYIAFIVKRYKKSGAIFSWELCNEPRCSQCDTSIITNWATSISQYIKSLDKQHLVAVGDEGWLTPQYAGPGNDGSYPYSAYEGVDHVALINIPTIDYGTFHLYPQYWGKDFYWGSIWIEQHSDIGKAANKPVVLEEYAAPDPASRALWFPQYYDSVIRRSSVASDSVWQFGSQFANENPYDSNAVFYSTDPNSEYQKLLITHKNDMAAKKPITAI